MKKRVIGIGGVFFKCKDPDQTREWCGRHLGLVINPDGSTFEFRNAERPEEKNYLQWSTFKSDTDHMEPSRADFMINYRVEDLELLLVELRKEGVQICDEVATYDYGKFVHIMDLEGNKIELWEPIDSVMTQIGSETTK